MKYLFFLIFLSVTIYSQTNIGIIKGRVIDADYDSNAVAGANVILLNEELGAATDMKGYYEIKNVPLGIHILQCSFLGYATQKDTIQLTVNKTEIKNNFYLRVLKIPISMPDSLKEYHNLFSCYKPDEILSIFIDSLSQDYRTVYLTFTNQTKYPIYLIEDLLCFNTVSIILKNESGETIRRNMLSGCDVIPITLPKKNNLIKLEPFTSIHFPPFIMQAYYINSHHIPKGKYYICLKYEIKDYKYLPGVYSSTEFDYYTAYKEEIEVLNQATRGTYFSENELLIEK